MDFLRGWSGLLSIPTLVPGLHSGSIPSKRPFNILGNAIGFLASFSHASINAGIPDVCERR